MINRSTLTPVITKFTPVGDHVLVRRHERAEKVGSIVMPTNAMHVGQARFDVLKTGPKCVSVKPGDIAFAPAQLSFGKVTVGTEELEVAPESLLTAYIPA